MRAQSIYISSRLVLLIMFLVTTVFARGSQPQSTCLSWISGGKILVKSRRKWKMFGGDTLEDGVIGYVDGCYLLVSRPGGSLSQEERRNNKFFAVLRITVENFVPRS